MKCYALKKNGKVVTYRHSKIELWRIAMSIDGYGIYCQVLPCWIVDLKKKGFSVIDGSFIEKKETK